MFKYLVGIIILLVLIIIIAVLTYIEIISFELITTLIALFTFIFAVFTYKKDNLYKKNKDTYDYVDNLIYKKFYPLINELNERMVYFDYYFELPLSKQMEHKKTLKEMHHFLADLNNKLDHDILNINIIKTYFNESFKNALLGMYLHFDITFLDYPSEVDDLYIKFFDDFNSFKLKRQEQRNFFIEYFNKHVVNNIQIEINNKKLTLNEWIRYTNLTDCDCSKKKEILHALQILKNIYSKDAGIYVSLGNLFHYCFSDNKRAINHLEKAIKINPLLIEAYLSLTAITFHETKNIKDILIIYNNMPIEVAKNDSIIQQKSALFLSSGDLQKCLETANMISNENQRNEFLFRIKKV